MKNNVFWAILLLVIFLSLSNTSKITPVVQPVTIAASDNSELASLIDAGVVFTGANKYLAGTSLTSESVRIFKENGENKDLGYKSLNSGTLSVTPNEKYKFYFFMNTTPSTQYYVDVQDYTGKLQDSSDNVIGHGCTIDTAPLVIVRNSNGNTQTSTTTGQTIGASSSASVEVEIRSHSDKCFGTPGAPKDNVICFGYDSTAFSSVKANTDYESIPSSLASVYTGTASCYKFPVLEDAAKTVLTVTLTSSADPTTDNNISIFTDDIAFDINQENLAEIWGYVDESSNQLARVITSTPDNYIRVA